MNIAKIRLATLSLFGVLALITSSAQGATVTGSLTVTATVSDTCSVNSPPLAFGTYNPASVSDSTATITVTCTTGTTYTVGLGKGNGSGATVTARKMTSGANTLNYALYNESTRTTNWGDTALTNWVSGTGTGSAQNLTVYGRVPASQYVASGSYEDIVTITVTY